jgi:hypothetical protein
VLSEKVSICRQNALTNARELLTHFEHQFNLEGATPEEILNAVLNVARTFTDYTTGALDREKAESVAIKMEEGNGA